MATTENFSSMLREYTPYNLLVEEMKKRNYFWNKVSKQTGWKGGNMVVPFEGGEYSSLSFGALTTGSDIADMTPVEGSISTIPELWGSMKFQEKDLDRHDSLEQSFLTILPGKLNQFMKRMSERVSISMLGDNSLAKLSADGDATGIISIDHPEYFTVGEKVEIDDDDSAVQLGYVTAIDINAKTITIENARSAGSAVDLSAYSTAQNAKVYLPGGVASGFTGLKSQLLSSANGGSAALFGQTKTAYPYLQGIQNDGSTITATNILDVLYDHFFDVASLGKGEPVEILVSYKNFKNCTNALQSNRRFSGGEKTGGFGFRSIELLGPDNDMRLTAIREMPDDVAYHIDWRAMKVHGDKFFERKRHMDNSEYFMERATSGYTYIVDMKFYGDLVVHAPSHCGITHSIDYVG